MANTPTPDEIAAAVREATAPVLPAGWVAGGFTDADAEAVRKLDALIRTELERVLPMKLDDALIVSTRALATWHCDAQL